MSLKTLPLLFINLGGEMIYILDQRLKAQEIPPDKAKKVMHDIAGTMLNKRFMEELFKPQEMYSKKAMRTVFDRLAHASIMRLNPASMDKLYDLMTMAFKYQVSLALRPKDVLLVTLNHMDAIRKFTEGSKTLTQQVENVFNLMIKTYNDLLPGEFMLIRQTLLNFFQDNHIKVSIFLKDGVQGNNGRFILPLDPYVPIGTEIPGTIKIFDASEKEKQTIKFNPGQKYQKMKEEGSFKLTGSRNTALGANMYSVARAADTTTPSPEATATAEAEAPAAVAIGKASTSKDAKPSTKAPQPSTASLEAEEPEVGGALDPKAKEHLDMLSKLLAPAKKPSGKDDDFRLNLFKTDEEEEAAALLRTPTKHETMLVNIDASKRGQNKALSKISGQMAVENPSQDANLLDLLDESRQ